MAECYILHSHAELRHPRHGCLLKRAIPPPPPPPLVPTRCKLLPYSHVSWKVNSFLPA